MPTKAEIAAAAAELLEAKRLWLAWGPTRPLTLAEWSRTEVDGDASMNLKWDWVGVFVPTPGNQFDNHNRIYRCVATLRVKLGRAYMFESIANAIEHLLRVHEVDPAKVLLIGARGQANVPCSIIYPDKGKGQMSYTTLFDANAGWFPRGARAAGFEVV